MENRVSTWSLRILDIDDPKIVQKLAFFLGIDINVFMGDPSTLSLSLICPKACGSCLSAGFLYVREPCQK